MTRSAIPGPHAARRGVHVNFESKRIDIFVEPCRLFGVAGGDTGVRPFHLMLPARPPAAPVPMCSTGGCAASGDNTVAGWHTLGLFDLPPRGCTVRPDGAPVVDRRRLS